MAMSARSPPDRELMCWMVLPGGWEMTEIFKEQFALIDQEFRKAFAELFGGGKAELIEQEAGLSQLHLLGFDKFHSMAAVAAALGNVLSHLRFPFT